MNKALINNLYRYDIIKLLVLMDFDYKKLIIMSDDELIKLYGREKLLLAFDVSHGANDVVSLVVKQ